MVTVWLVDSGPAESAAFFDNHVPGSYRAEVTEETLARWRRVDSEYLHMVKEIDEIVRQLPVSAGESP